MTLLQLISAVCAELGLAAPSVVVSNTNRQVTQMLYLANSLGRELAEWPDANWRKLQEEFTFTTDGTGSSALPSDFVKILSNTSWDRTSDRPIFGPDTPQGWQWLKSSNQGTAGIALRYRLYGDTVEYWPSDDSGTSCVIDILSNNWVVDGDDSSEKSSFTKDSDTCVFRDSLMIAGIKAKFLEAKGMDNNAAMGSYQRALIAALAQDKGATNLPLVPQSDDAHLMGWCNIPDTGYG